MRILLLALCSCIFIAGQAQRFNGFARANMITATGIQSGKLKNGYGMGGGVEMALKKSSPLKLVAAIDMGINGLKSMPYEFTYQGNYTQTKINFTSYLFNFSTGLRYVMNEGKTIAPFVGLHAGALNYYSEMVIEDPEDPNGCHAIDSKPITSGVSFTGTVETGIRFTPHSQTRAKGLPFYEIGAGYVRGTRAEYVRFTKDETGSGQDYWVEFQSPTSEVHEHSVGKIYHSYTSQVAIHFAVVFPF